MSYMYLFSLYYLYHKNFYTIVSVMHYVTNVTVSISVAKVTAAVYLTPMPQPAEKNSLPLFVCHMYLLLLTQALRNSHSTRHIHEYQESKKYHIKYISTTTIIITAYETKSKTYLFHTFIHFIKEKQTLLIYYTLARIQSIKAICFS